MTGVLFIQTQYISYKHYNPLKPQLFFLSLVTVCILWSCSAVKFVPDNKYLLESVEVRCDDDSVDASALVPYIHQKANSKWFSVFKIPLATYALSGRNSSRWINRTLRRIGESPVIYDSVQASASIEDLRQALVNRGYMHADVELETKCKGKKMRAVYTLHPGAPYYIGNVSYNIEDSAIANVLACYHHKLAKQKKASNAGLQPGERFTVSRLNDERRRITSILLDSGFYKFHKDYIVFDADTSSVDNKVNLALHLLKYHETSNSPASCHPRYFIRTISYRQVGEGSSRLRKPVLEMATAINKGQPFNASDLQATYNKFARLQAVKYTNISFTEVPDSALLDCNIQVSTKKPSSLSFQPEGTNTAGDFGAAASLTYLNRNLFRGSEELSLQFRGAFEAITGLEGYHDENYRELGLEAKLSFPNFVAPFLSHSFRKRSYASSELAVAWNSQNRPEFHRRVFSAAWRYRWSDKPNHLNFRLDALDLNYVYMPWISEKFKHDYLDSVSNRNAILRYNYEDLFIMKIGFGLTYNNGADAIRANVETAGNVLSALSHTAGFKRNENGQSTLFNIAFAQYAKFDFDYTRLVQFDNHNALALHGSLGVAIPYGNSDVLPFEKRYFSGGANSVRGWGVRQLGPGKFRGTDGRIDFINQTGDMKLDLSMEYRTFLFWKFNGAVFVDAGNIWTLRDYKEQPGGQFKFDEFYKQIAVAYGLGIRLNFDYFILRFDMGMKAVNPSYVTQNEHWALLHPDFSRDFSFHFAVGMPF